MIFLNNGKLGNVFQQNWYDFHNIAVIIVESQTKVVQTDNVCAAKQTPSGRRMFVRCLAPQCWGSQTKVVWTANVCTVFGTAMFVQPNKRRLDAQCLAYVWPA